MGHRWTAAALSSGAFASATPGVCRSEGQLQLPRRRRADLIPRMFCRRRVTVTTWRRDGFVDGAALIAAKM